MKKVLITGANGFTGYNLVEALEGSEWEAIPLTQEKTGFKNEVTIDFCAAEFAGVLETLPAVEAVVHLGARVGWAGQTRAELFQPNVLATAQLVNWVRQHHGYFIFASAALICGERNTHITPGCQRDTENDYLYSKWLGEEIIEMSGIRAAILRISGIFGKNGPAHLGLNRAIAGALKGKPPVLTGSGNIKRNYIYVKDLCRAIRYCLDREMAGSHLVAGSFTNTMAEMLEMICTELLPGQKPEIRPGSDGFDQVVDPSPLLPQTRTFAEAIKDIKNQR